MTNDFYYKAQDFFNENNIYIYIYIYMMILCHSAKTSIKFYSSIIILDE